MANTGRVAAGLAAGQDEMFAMMVRIIVTIIYWVNPIYIHTHIPTYIHIYIERERGGGGREGDA